MREAKVSTKVIKLKADGDPETGLQPCQYVDPANVVGSPPTETGHQFFANAAGNLTSGVWEATPYKETTDGYPVDEFMLVLSGSVTITDIDGNSDTFGPGDAFIMPKGFKGTWENTETVRKFYVILE